MNSPLIDIDLLALSDPLQSLIVTPNERIARKLIQSAQWGEGEQKSCWEAPPVQSLDDWISECWSTLQISGHPAASQCVLLSTLELSNVWARVIGDDPSYSSILNGLELASVAVSAHRSIELWQADAASFVPDSFETERFLAWYEQVKSECQLRGWVTFEAALAIVAEALSLGDLSLPPQIKLIGFDETPPLIENLFEVLSDKSVVCIENDLCNHNDTTISKLEVSERKDQPALTALWAKDLLSKDLNLRIAIVCPELANNKESIETAFKRVFEPQTFLLDTPRYTSPFNISAGDALGTTPIISAILSWVSSPSKKLRLDEISRLITSPFIGGASKERNERLRFVKRLAKSRLQQMELFDLLQYVDIPPLLGKLISTASLKYKNSPHSQNLSQWAFWVNDFSTSLGWPGERSLDSEEYQAVQQWNCLLDSYAGLEKVYKGCSISSAVSLLRQCGNDIVFKPESHDSPIQILGALEAAGLHFDHVWVIDMNDDVWPPAASPNPFLPLDIQKDLDMPHSSAERELDFSKRIFTRLCASGKDVVLSYGKWDDDRELRESALIDQIEPMDQKDLNLSQAVPYAELIQASTTTEIISDPLVPITDNTLRGGSGIFTSQSQCPFQGFAKYRLRAGEATDDQPGLSAAERGNIIHNSLDEFWKNFKSQADLKSIDNNLLDMHIGEAVDHAIFLLKNASTTLSKIVLEIEKERTVTLIRQWLEFEKTRSPFTVVAREKSMPMEVGGLKINIRVDRIDELDDGRKFPIDYKTGRASIRDWAGSRPSNLQIPIYAIAPGNDGVAIASLRRDEVEMKGIIASDSVDGLINAEELPDRLDMPTSWDGVKSQWNDTLNQLGKEYQSGVNSVTPTHTSNCRYCPYDAICRKSV